MPQTDSVDSTLPCPPKDCHARRHIRPASFMTYDAMVARAKSGENYTPGDDLFFWGTLATLANANNRSKEQEGEAIDWLLGSKWIIEVEAKRRWRGQWTTPKYRILEHEEYARTYGTCPSYLYNPETGERIGQRKGKEPAHLALAKIDKYYERLYPEGFETGTATGKSVPVGQRTATGKPVSVVPQPIQEKPTTDTGKPVPTDTGKPVTSRYSQPVVEPDTHTPQPVTAPRKPGALPEWVCVLFQQKNKFVPGFGEKHKEAILQFVEADGEKRVQAAYEEFLRQAPWDDKTTTHLRYFVNGYVGYRDEGDKKGIAPPEPTEEQLEKARRRSYRFDDAEGIRMNFSILMPQFKGEWNSRFWNTCTPDEIVEAERFLTAKQSDEIVKVIGSTDATLANARDFYKRMTDRFNEWELANPEPNEFDFLELLGAETETT